MTSRQLLQALQARRQALQAFSKVGPVAHFVDAELARVNFRIVRVLLSF